MLTSISSRAGRRLSACRRLRRAESDADYWLSEATFTLVEGPCTDRRPFGRRSMRRSTRSHERVTRWPHRRSGVRRRAACVRTPTGPAIPGVVTESLAYSTLQSGPEFARWLAERGPGDGARTARSGGRRAAGDTLLRCGSTGRSGTTRSPPMPARRCSRRSRSPGSIPSVTEVVSRGNGPSFCSGGDLAEFGTFDDPASAHLARTRHSPALALDDARRPTRPRGAVPRCTVRCSAAAWRWRRSADTSRAAPTRCSACRSWRSGSIPGAGGTVSVTRRIGRWRTAYLVLSGETIDAATALEWGLVDAVRLSQPRAAQGHPIRVLLGQEVADRQLDGPARRVGVQPVHPQHRMPAATVRPRPPRRRRPATP